MMTADLISRSALMAHFEQDEWGTPDERWRPEREFGQMVLNAPAVDAEPVKILHEGDSDYPLPMMLVGNRDNYTIVDVGGVCCVPLYQVIDILSGIKPDVIVRNGERICPNCGAKMDGEGNG